jgi:anti-anti-sigma factor
MSSPGGSPRQPNLEITRRHEGEHDTLALYGELDVVTCGDLAGGVREAWGRGRDVVVDLIGVTLIDSSGIRCLATLQSESGPGRGLELIPARRHVQRVLELAGVADMFTYRTS